EDGIRDFHVTGVQTCALPIYPVPFNEVHPGDYGPCMGCINDAEFEGKPRLNSSPTPARAGQRMAPGRSRRRWRPGPANTSPAQRSEERRVGKEGRLERARYVW